MSFFYDWKEYFRNNPETEEMFQAFKSRIDEDPEDTFDLEEDIESQKRVEKRHHDEENESNFLRIEHFREQHAIKKGYTFKPKTYDPEERYK